MKNQKTLEVLAANLANRNDEVMELVFSGTEKHLQTELPRIPEMFDSQNISNSRYGTLCGTFIIRAVLTNELKLIKVGSKVNVDINLLTEMFNVIGSPELAKDGLSPVRGSGDQPSISP